MLPRININLHLAKYTLYSPLPLIYLMKLYDYTNQLCQINYLWALDFFSPSKEDVSIKQRPPSREVLITIRSAGNISFSSHKHTSPTLTSAQLKVLNSPSLYNLHLEEFNSTSEILLYLSSRNSLPIDKQITNIKGSHAPIGLIGEIILID